MICATESRAVFFADILNDVGASVVGEINVNVRWIDALGIQKPLEQQAVADRVNVRNFQQIGDDRTGGATARDARHAHFAAFTDEIADD